RGGPVKTTDHNERPWLDSRLDIEKRVDLLLTELTLEEKAGQLHMSANVEPVRDRELLLKGGIGASLYASGATAGNVSDEGLLVAAINECQRTAVDGSRLGIPVLFGRDVIHGHR